MSPLSLLGKRLTGAANLLFNRGGNFPADVARALLADVNAQRPDHLVVSGDLSNLSYPGEFRLVDQLLQGADLPAEQITVVPGNHDCYTRGTLRREVFSAHLGRYLRGQRQPGPGAFPLLKLQPGLAVLALDSSRPSAPLMAVGTLGGRQLRLARWLLGLDEARRRFRLVVVHHPPLPTHTHWHNGLTDAEALLEVLREAGADLVVHGHIHRHSRGSVPGPDGEIPVISAGSGTWLSPDDPERRAQYNLYRLRDGALDAVQIRRYNPQSGAFEPA